MSHGERRRQATGTAFDRCEVGFARVGVTGLQLARPPCPATTLPGTAMVRHGVAGPAPTGGLVWQGDGHENKIKSVPKAPEMRQT